MVFYKDRQIQGYYCNFEQGHIIDETTGKAVEQFLLKKDYLYVKLKTGKNRFRNFQVHKILCHTQYQGHKTGFQVHHINGIKTDNRIQNLVYITHKEHSGITGAQNFKKVWKNQREQMLKYASAAGKKAMAKATRQFHVKGGKAGCKTLIEYWSKPENIQKRKIISEQNSLIMKNRVWINNGVINKRVDKELVSEFINNGFVRGRLK